MAATAPSSDVDFEHLSRRDARRHLKKSSRKDRAGTWKWMRGQRAQGIMRDRAAASSVELPDQFVIARSRLELPGQPKPQSLGRCPSCGEWLDDHSILTHPCGAS